MAVPDRALALRKHSLKPRVYSQPLVSQLLVCLPSSSVSLLSLMASHTGKSQHKMQVATKLRRRSLAFEMTAPGSAAQQRGVTCVNVHISL